MNKVRDFELRKAYILNKKDFLKSGQFVNEYNINRATIDFVLFNEDFHAFEIKSEADTLKRLPNQLLCYECIADFIELVVFENHFKKALPLIQNPVVGITIATKKDNEIIFEPYRKPERNIPEKDFILHNCFAYDIRKLCKSKGIKLKSGGKYINLETVKELTTLQEAKTLLFNRFKLTYGSICPECKSQLTYNTSRIEKTEIKFGGYKKITRNFYTGCFECGQETFKNCYDTIADLNKEDKLIFQQMLKQRGMELSV